MGPASLLGGVAVAALGRSWRIERRDTEAWDRRLEAGERCIFAFWHARLFPLVYTHRHRGIGVLVSRHHDGELIARILARLGFPTARGSSTRGGEEGMLGLLELAGRGHLLAITPDGPRGPAERVKPGLVFLASRTGLPIVPAASAARDAWVFRSWDRFRVPRPFTRVVVAYGPPIAVPPRLGPADAAAWSERVGRAIAELTAATAAAAGER